MLWILGISIAVVALLYIVNESWKPTRGYDEMNSKTDNTHGTGEG